MTLAPPRGWRLAAPLLLALAQGAPAIAQDDEGSEAVDFAASATPEDVAEGREVFARSGCRECHGWDGSGLGMADHRPTGANLRESVFDAYALDDLIRCGIPGTSMPGITFADTDEQFPNRVESVRKADRLRLVAYLLSEVVGQGPATVEDCAAYFASADAAECASLPGAPTQ